MTGLCLYCLSLLLSPPPGLRAGADMDKYFDINNMLHDYYKVNLTWKLIPIQTILNNFQISPPPLTMWTCHPIINVLNCPTLR